MAGRMYRIGFGERSFDVELVERRAGLVTFKVDGELHEVAVDPVVTRNIALGAGRPPPAAAARPRAKGPAQAGNAVCSPMPGVIVKILVAPGQEIASGAAVAVVEAMKMENTISAARHGKVKNVLVKERDEVTGGQPLVEFE